MADRTPIEWTDATWNPVRGCSRVSEGCRNCYAERVASRFSGPGLPYEGLARNGRWTGVVRLVPDALAQPLRWKRPRRIFVNSMSDLFHERLPFTSIDRVFMAMERSPQHTFQVLTKRPERMREYLELWDEPPLPNVWLGVSVEDQRSADERIPLLLETPAAVRFVSAEPLLGHVDLDADWLYPRCTHCGRHWHVRHATGCFSPYTGDDDCDGKAESTALLDWVIVGGESGRGARPMHPDWARSLRDQCTAAGVPFFFKQWGEWRPLEIPHMGCDPECLGHRVGKRAAGRELDGRTWDEVPPSTSREVA